MSTTCEHCGLPERVTSPHSSKECLGTLRAELRRKDFVASIQHEALKQALEELQPGAVRWNVRNAIRTTEES